MAILTRAALSCLLPLPFFLLLATLLINPGPPPPSWPLQDLDLAYSPLKAYTSKRLFGAVSPDVNLFGLDGKEHLYTFIPVKSTTLRRLLGRWNPSLRQNCCVHVFLYRKASAADTAIYTSTCTGWVSETWNPNSSRSWGPEGRLKIQWYLNGLTAVTHRLDGSLLVPLQSSFSQLLQDGDFDRL